MLFLKLIPTKSSLCHLFTHEFWHSKSYSSSPTLYTCIFFTGHRQFKDDCNLNVIHQERLCMQLQEEKHNRNHKLNIPPYILRYKDSTVQRKPAGDKEGNTEWMKEVNTSRSNTWDSCCRETLIMKQLIFHTILYWLMSYIYHTIF